MIEMSEQKNKFIQFAIICEIEGNVNADERIGQRITIKKFVSKEGIYPYVSARAIKKGIKETLSSTEENIDPYSLSYGEQKQKGDSGDFIKYIDQDIFGYMIPTDPPIRRKSPIEISYLVSIHPVPITVEFGGRFPKFDNPVPFEIEQAKFVGKFYGNIYNYIGVFHESEIKEEILKKLENGEYKNEIEQANGEEGIGKYFVLKKDKRVERLKKVLRILLLGKFRLPRSTNQLNQGFYRYVVLLFSKSLKPLPAYVTINYKKEREYEIYKSEKDGKIVEKVVEKYNEGYELDLRRLEEFSQLLEDGETIYVIDFVGNLKTLNNTKIEIVKPQEVEEKIISKIENFINFDDIKYYLNFYKGYIKEEKNSDKGGKKRR
jgi:CRISPR-associated protein Cst2